MNAQNEKGGCKEKFTLCFKGFRKLGNFKNFQLSVYLLNMQKYHKPKIIL